jgi:hypothetical protein
MKRGGLEIRYIILLLLGVIVLITLLYIFRGQVSLFTQTLFGISESANASLPNLENIVGG